MWKLGLLRVHCVPVGMYLMGPACKGDIINQGWQVVRWQVRFNLWASVVWRAVRLRHGSPDDDQA